MTNVNWCQTVCQIPWQTFLHVTTRNSYNCAESQVLLYFTDESAAVGKGQRAGWGTPCWLLLVIPERGVGLSGRAVCPACLRFWDGSPATQKIKRKNSFLGEGMAQVIEHLPRMWEALGSTRSTTQNKCEPTRHQKQ
jgi:hypothetical protein